MAQQFFHDIAKNVGQMIKFTSVVTGEFVEYPAFVTSFSDSFTVNWGGGAQIFGRSDPIKNYQSTSRRINASFDILGPSKAKAIENFQNYSKLIRMLYPMYGPAMKDQNNSRTIVAGPLMRIKYSNYIASPSSADGLLGCISGVDFRPDYDGGHFLNKSGGSDTEMIPVKYSLTFLFEPLHETPLGFGEDGKFLGNKFPYNQQDPRPDGEPPAVAAGRIAAFGGT